MVYTPRDSASMRTALNSASPSFSFVLLPPATVTLAAVPLPSVDSALGTKLTCESWIGQWWTQKLFFPSCTQLC